MIIMTDTPPEQPPNATNTSRTVVIRATPVFYTGRPVEVITQIWPDNDDDDDSSVTSLYGCCICHSFGVEGTICGRCVEDSNGYYTGNKMTEKSMAEAIKIMEEEDREMARSDSDYSDNEDNEDDEDN
jgi:hypothetical protein